MSDHGGIELPATLPATFGLPRTKADFPMPVPGGVTDRLRFTVIEMNTDDILSRDLIVMEPKVTKNLSAPSSMQFQVAFGESTKSAQGIDWKNWGQWVICEIEIDYEYQVFAYGIVTECPVDPESGTLTVTVTGPMGYPKGIPWLENFNPIAVDPFEVVQRCWGHAQGFPNAQLGVEVYPQTSGTQMLPGYGFDGSILSFDFFAMFIRAVDFNDCGDTIVGLARDIPFDMFEEAEWNETRTELTRKIKLAYPLGGVVQENLRFVLGENVLQAEKAEELDIEPVSDVIIRGWLPGKVYSSRLQNADMTRARRVIMEEDAYIDSTERAAAWAKRKLQRRNVPKHFAKIVINPHHPNAPLGSFDVGDTIQVRADHYPWTGEIDEAHRIISISYDEASGMAELQLKAEGAFNYDPIDYNPDFENQPVEDPNRIRNGYFSENMGGWSSIRGQWIRVATQTYDDTFNPLAGCVRIDCDDDGELLRSAGAYVTPGEEVIVQCAVRWTEVASGSTDAFQLRAVMLLKGAFVGTVIIDEFVHPTGVHGWELLQDIWTVPDGVDEVRLDFNVTAGVSAGTAYWTYARLYGVDEA